MNDAPHSIPPFQGLSWDDFEVSGLGLLGYRFTGTFSLASGFFAQYGAQEGMTLNAVRAPKSKTKPR